MNANTISYTSKTSEELLEHYRDVQDGIQPTLIRGKPVYHTEKTPLFKGWAFKNYLMDAFIDRTKNWDTIRVLDHGCGKAAYLYDPEFTELFHKTLGGRLQSFYCYDPGYRAYMQPPAKGVRFNAVISAGVFAAIPERDIDQTLAEMRDWCEPDGVIFMKIPLTAHQERRFVDTNESVYITVKPIEYWLEKFETILQRNYYAVFAHSPSDKVVYENSRRVS